MNSKVVLFCAVFYVALAICSAEVGKIETITVFGSTGTIGKKVLAYALEKGYKLRAGTRNSAKVPENLRDKVEIYQGDVLDQDAVDKAVEGTDAVIITLGTTHDLGPTTALSEGTKNIVKSMLKNNVTTVSVILSLFLYPEETHPPQFDNLTAELGRMYDAIKDTSLNYIAVFSPYFTTDEPKGPVLITINEKKSPGQYISENELAKFLVDSLTQPKYYKAVVGLANP